MRKFQTTLPSRTTWEWLIIRMGTRKIAKERTEKSSRIRSKISGSRGGKGDSIENKVIKIL